MQNKHDEVAKKDDYIMYCDKYKKGTGNVKVKESESDKDENYDRESVKNKKSFQLRTNEK